MLKEQATNAERGHSDALEEIKWLRVKLEEERRKGQVIVFVGVLSPSGSHVEVSPSMVDLVVAEAQTALEIAKLHHQLCSFNSKAK